MTIELSLLGKLSHKACHFFIGWSEHRLTYRRVELGYTFDQASKTANHDKRITRSRLDSHPNKAITAHSLNRKDLPPVDPSIILHPVGPVAGTMEEG